MLSGTHWTKQVFLCAIPAFPIGYLCVHSFRMKNILSWLYIDRLDIQIPDHISSMVESELERVPNLRKANLTVTFTDRIDPRTFGGFFIRQGAEIQLPLRVCLSDLQDVSKLGKFIEFDAGILRKKKQVSIDSPHAQNILSDFILSENACRFLIQRELRRANSGKIFCMPIILWIAAFGLSFMIFSVVSTLADPIVALFFSYVVALTTFYSCYRNFVIFSESKLDTETCESSASYTEGAIDYFRSSMRFNQSLRLMCMDAIEYYKENGDRSSDWLPYSRRLQRIRNIANSHHFEDTDFKTVSDTESC
ncbi:hypothetical protein AB6A40_008537 [Gnathostoma spinigerum]|uniref:Calcium uniporter protein n=1 Tax=Gnathostoma spinigerum TaxID=75299 RepID=A0ABD6EPN6_9BILA